MGYFYFGARYYDSDLSVWLSVDAMADKHSDYTPYAYVYNKPITLIDPLGLDTILVNKKSGEVLDTHKGGEDYVYVTKKNVASEKAWRKSDQLFYNLNISGDNGGTPSKKGEPVIWSALDDYTEDFNSVLLSVTSQFEATGKNYDDEEFTVPGNRYLEKMAYLKRWFKTNAPYDIKQNAYHPRNKGEWSWYNGKLTRYDDYGNMLYGCAGTALGLNKFTLTWAAEVAQWLSTFNSDLGRDKTQIIMGIEIYNSKFRKFK